MKAVRQFLSVQRILGLAGISFVLMIVLMRGGENLRGQGGAVPPVICFRCDVNGCMEGGACPPDYDSKEACEADCKVYCNTGICEYSNDLPEGTQTYSGGMNECRDFCFPDIGGGTGGGGTGGGAVAPPQACGNGQKEGNEECDDGNQDDEDACTSACKNAKCGDGLFRMGFEECDDGNQIDTDACSTACKSARCGDGLVWEGKEKCDDGNQNDEDKCSNTCNSRSSCTTKEECIGKITDLKECIDIAPAPPFCVGRVCDCNLGFCVAVDYPGSGCPMGGIGGVGVIGGISGTDGGQDDDQESGESNGGQDGAQNGGLTGGSSQRSSSQRSSSAGNVTNVSSSKKSSSKSSSTSLCGNGRFDIGEQCGEPAMPPCRGGAPCQDCRCQAVCGDGVVNIHTVSTNASDGIPNLPSNETASSSFASNFSTAFVGGKKEPINGAAAPQDVNSQCPSQDPNEKWSKTTHSWCQGFTSQGVGAGTYYMCNFSACMGDGTKDFGFAGELYGIEGVTGRGFADDPNSDLYFRSCGEMHKCWDGVKYGLPAVITGTVYEDKNTSTCCSGKFDSGELGIKGRKVTITNNWLGEPYVESTTTDDKGGYLFGPLFRGTNVVQPAGTYRVSLELLPGEQRTTDNSIVKIFAPGLPETYDFGIYQALPSPLPPGSTTCPTVEQCDDGNKRAGDGCDPCCQRESSSSSRSSSSTSSSRTSTSSASSRSSSVSPPPNDCSQCESCGTGVFNICGQSECLSLGPCIYSERFGLGGFFGVCAPDPIVCDSTITSSSSSRTSTSSSHTSTTSSRTSGSSTSSSSSRTSTSSSSSRTSTSSSRTSTSSTSSLRPSAPSAECILPSECQQCSTCGTGVFSVCDQAECLSLGPCAYTERFNLGSLLGTCVADPTFCDSSIVCPSSSSSRTSSRTSSLRSSFGEEDGGDDAGRTSSRCGDGFLDDREECDDGNRRSGDGCDGICRLEDGGGDAGGTSSRTSSRTSSLRSTFGGEDDLSDAERERLFSTRSPTTSISWEDLSDAERERLRRESPDWYPAERVPSEDLSDTERERLRREGVLSDREASVRWEDLSDAERDRLQRESPDRYPTVRIPSEDLSDAERDRLQRENPDRYPAQSVAWEDLSDAERERLQRERLPSERDLPWDSDAERNRKSSSFSSSFLPRRFFSIPSITIGFCGDGTLQEREECDDGNTNGTDGCSPACLLEHGVCGDKIIQKGLGEQCDDGNRLENDRCNNRCFIPGGPCGDGLIAYDEECDDGNQESRDGCSSACLLEFGSCGDAILQRGLDEQCDDGNKITNDTCDDRCITVRRGICGNGTLTPDEECDDRNLYNNDGCSAVCLLEFGTCGDGVIQRGLGEQCEPRLHDPELPYRCNTQNCRFLSLFCGDGKLDAGEQCDFGKANSNRPNAFCQEDCSLPRCGDKTLEVNEECDDGNLLPNDGCDRLCRLEQFRALPSLPYASTTQRPLQPTHAPVGDTGPATLAVMAAGASAGWGWVRRRRRRAA